MSETEREATEPFQRSDRIAAIGVSEILQFGARARQLEAKGFPVITLGAGEPDFNTPENVKTAAHDAIRGNETRYTPLSGTITLREAIQSKLKRDNGLDYLLDEITVAAGAKQVIFNALLASINPGDEVIIAAPFWTSYVDLIKIAGGKPIIIQCDAENGFKLNAGQLASALSNQTRWVLFNSPSNPSGAVYSEDEYRPLLEVILRWPNVWIMSDDIYEHIVYQENRFITPVNVDPRTRSRCLLVNGVSKAYAMTGWRLGFGAGPSELVAAMSVVQSNSTSAPSSISQCAAVEALAGPQTVLRDNRKSFQHRRDYVVQRINRMDGVSCALPEGAFYAFAQCQGLFGRRTPGGSEIKSDRDFCRYLLERFHVAVVPGVVFGLSGHFRISYAASQVQLETAMDRIELAIRELSP